MEGFLGNGASFAADLSLLAYTLLILPVMVVGFVFARQKMFFPHHKWVMTFLVIFNWVLIAFLMAVSYMNTVAPTLPEGLSEVVYLLPTIHLVTGVIAQLLATYLVILMWTENTRFQGIVPASVRIRNVKLAMRVTLLLWIITVLLGVTIYFSWYVSPIRSLEGSDDTVPAPALTEEIPEPATTETIVEPAATEDLPEAVTTEEPNS